MKKILVLVALVSIMIGSLGRVGFSVSANYYEDIPEAIPAQPVE